jgi:hypothetical protein
VLGNVAESGNAHYHAAFCSIGGLEMPALKTLEDHVRDGTWRARLAHHREMLSGPVLPWSKLALLQAAYAATQHELEKREIARDFQRTIHTLNEDEDERAARDAEQAELDAIVNAPPTEIDEDEIGQTLDSWNRALLARDLRNGAARERGLTWREIAEELHCSVSTARRLVASLQRPTAV